MKSLLRLHISIIQDLGDLHGVETRRDIEYLISRHLAEGDSFLTIVLPAFSDAIIESLNAGHMLTCIPGFRFAGRLPSFLRGFTRHIFSKDGTILDRPDPQFLRAIRQICELTKKVERPVAKHRLLAAEMQYVKTDEDLIHVEEMVTRQSKRVASLRACFEFLFRDILDSVENRIANFDLVPRHGPGATSEGYSPKEKWAFPSWYESVEEVFPSTLYARPSQRSGPLPLVPPEQEDPVRIIFVPKTMKAPRVIAIEPSCRMYVQQAVARHLYDELRRLYPSSLDLFDQKTNAAWAWFGSCDGSVATLDLSEASDRLSWQLLLCLIGRRPHLRDALSVARSKFARIPRGDVIHLRKFASMGSALTFPIQSMVFFAIACLGRFELGTLSRSLNDISVFGDDIIVPSAESAEVAYNLEVFGLKVNGRKSHSTGFYRESCGEEYFQGEDVSIFRLRKDLPTSSSDAELLASAASFRNKCYISGCWRTASYLDEILGRVVTWRPAPVEHPTLSRWTFLDVPADRVSPSLQRDEIRRPVVRPVGKKYHLDDDGGLLAWFLLVEGRRRVSISNNPFEKSERPVAFAVYNRWAPL